MSEIEKKIDLFEKTHVYTSLEIELLKMKGIKTIFSLIKDLNLYFGEKKYKGIRDTVESFIDEKLDTASGTEIHFFLQEILKCIELKLPKKSFKANKVKDKK